MNDDGPAPIRSSLNLSNNVDVSFMKRRAFHDTNVLIVNLDEAKIDSWERQMLENIGTRLYGRRKRKGE